MKKQLLLGLFAIPLIVNAQFFQNFDSSNAIPTGWTALNGGDGNTWEIIEYTTSDIMAYSGTRTASLRYGSSAHDDYLVTPAITVTAGLSDFLSFYARSRDSDYPETISLKISTTTPTADAFTDTLAASVAPASGADFYRYSYDLSAYIGQTIYIGFYSSTTDLFYIDIDDVFNGAIPACDVPSSIVVNGVTSNSASISWMPSFTGNASYQVEYGSTGFVQGTGTVVNSGNMSAVLSNLNPSMAYQFYVRSNCAANGFSAWSSVQSFTTTCVPIATFPYVQNFDNTTLPSCWNNESVAGAGSATWKYVITNGNSSISPKSAPRMAEFRTESAGERAKLLMPPLNISGLANPELRFSLANVNWLGEVDELRIYYKSNPNDAWVQVGSSYMTENSSWLDVSIPLLSKSANYFIAFEGASNWSRGMNIDNVLILDTSATLGVNDVAKNSGIKLYPNPVKDVLNINSDKKLRSVEVFSLTGQLLQKVDNNAKQINMSGLEKGVYLLRVKSEGKDESFKIIKD